MYFTEIRLTNFGQFDGEHLINLSPETANDTTSRPIVLVGGKNGAGKTTLLDAVKLCLYGSAALSADTKQRTYDAYVNSHIHRRLGAPLANTFAEVGVSFVHTVDATPYAFEVRRSWQRTSRGLDETLTITQDGLPLTKTERVWWDKFLYDLLPPGLADLFFFDGEKIQALAEDTDYTILGASIRALLGLELVDRLRADLNIYLTRQKRVGQTGVGEELQILANERAALEETFSGAYAELAALKSRLDQKKGKVEEEERRLASEGGSVADRRNGLKARRDELRELIIRHERDINDQANALLPFAVVPSLCTGLRDRLLSEQGTLQGAAVQSLVASRVRDILENIIEHDEWLSATSVTSLDRQRIMERLRNAIEVAQAHLEGRGDVTPNKHLRHDLSMRDRDDLLHWLDQATTIVPQAMHDLGAGLDAALNELADIEAMLISMPSDEIVQPILQRLAALHQEIGRLQIHIAAQETVVQDLRNKRTELDRREQELYIRLMRGDDPTYRMALVGRVQGALVKYEEVLRRAKLSQLEERIVECFGRLSRKGNYVRKATIDSRTFETRLYNSKGEPIPKQDLSAGEKQIYAVAVLWALRLVSGRALPIIVDTPLGRLDSDHRHALVERYFPQASHQVVLLSTDTEIDKNLYHRLAPTISHAYRLVYQPSAATTEIVDGYFWQPPVIDEEVGVA